MANEGNGVTARLMHLERRLDQSEADRRDIWRHQGANEQSLAVLDERLKALHTDIEHLSGELRWVRRGMWGAAASFAMLLVAVASLVTQGGV